MQRLFNLERAIFRTSAFIAKQVRVLDRLAQKGLDCEAGYRLLAALRASQANLIESRRLLGHSLTVPRLMSIRSSTDVIGWRSIATAPFNRDLQLAVLGSAGASPLVFPCRRVLRGWLKSETNAPVEIYPTHWREWRDAFSPFGEVAPN